MMRGGYIKPVGNGIYTLFPVTKRITNKIERIMREEMDRIGGQEVMFPVAMPATLWKESGRFDSIGSELLRFRDRSGADMVLGMTHEEAATQFVRDVADSYTQYPFMIYQIQTKFRDEIRPRFGLMRGREFIMKDGYSFDATEEGAQQNYWACHAAYKRIFQRLGLKFRPVEADSGSIGGNFSHEFMVLAETGEDTIAYCTGCDWSANIERAAVLPPAKACEETCAAIEEVTTPDQHTIESAVSSRFPRRSSSRRCSTWWTASPSRPSCAATAS